MSEMEEKLNQVLSNPQMMQLIMALAQSLGSPAPEVKPEPKPQPKPEPPPASPPIDPGMLQKMAGMASSAGVDANQRSLLRALGPYISRERVNKLERAMRAAKMAVLASSLLQAQNRR